MCAVGVRELVRGAHDVLCDVSHQQADDHQHHADGPAHRCHGDDDVLHPGRRQGELHAVSPARRPLPLSLSVGAGQGAHADAVRDAFVQLGQQKVPAARCQVDAGALELGVAPVPPAAELEASAPAWPLSENSCGTVCGCCVRPVGCVRAPPL